MSETIKIDPFGFREYDARWLYPKNINGAGISEVGKGFGTQIIKINRWTCRIYNCIFKISIKYIPCC